MRYLHHSFHIESSKSGILHLISTSHFGQHTFQMLNSNKRLAATILGRAVLKQDGRE